MIELTKLPHANVVTALVCPRCLANEFTAGAAGLRCNQCTSLVCFDDGIVDVIGEDASLTVQERHYDEAVDVEWETWRPAGAPELHRWVLEQKLAGALELAVRSVEGATIVNVCSGSGMDAEFLFDRGADVVLVDLSLAALRRARTRLSARGYRPGLVRARTERLPFDDRSFDFGFVHDGLHHLDEPELAVRELARVARRAVFVLEPAASALTTIAVRLRLAVEVEDAGNVVRRLHSDEVARWLREGGMTETVSSRALIRQTHWPSRAQRWLSAAPLRPVARLTYRVVAFFPGRWVGNKLTVVGTRCE